jgi:hypothetical protein
VLYKCLSVRSMEYCTGLFVWGLEVCAQLFVGGVSVTGVRGGGLSCGGLCVFVIEPLRRLWVFILIQTCRAKNHHHHQ